MFQLVSLLGLEKGHMATHPNNSHKDCIPALFLEELSHILHLSLHLQVIKGPNHCFVCSISRPVPFSPVPLANEVPEQAQVELLSNQFA